MTDVLFRGLKSTLWTQIEVKHDKKIGIALLVSVYAVDLWSDIYALHCNLYDFLTTEQ